MRPSALPLCLATALALGVTSLSLQAAQYTYHGDLLDGDTPAEGRYDLRISAYADPGARKALGEATELPGVAVADGRFSAQFDLPDDPDGTTWFEVAVRKAGSDEPWDILGAPQPVTKANSTCPGAWALDGNSGVPVGSYLGLTGQYARLYINAPYGVEINTLDPLALAQAAPDAKGASPRDYADLTVYAKSTIPYSNDSADLHLVSGSYKRGVISVNDTNGAMELSSESEGFRFIDGLQPQTQNIGLGVFDFSGRLRSRAVGTNPTDTSGGLWFDDERAYASYVGRGDNASNWTGIYEAIGGWRFTVHDNGAFGFNTGTLALPANTVRMIADGGFGLNTDFTSANTDVSLGTKPATGDNDFDAILQSRNGKGARISVWDSTGLLQLYPYSAAGDTKFALGVDSSNVTGRFLTTGANNAYLSTGGAWTNGSSRTFKHAFDAVDVVDVLARVVALPLTRWQYRDSDEGVHLGPMAEDFAEAFGLGGSAQHISTVDADGVALAAIQGLNAKLERENAALRDEAERTRAALDDVLARLARLEADGAL